MDRVSWSLQGREPVIRHSAFSPVLADPTFLFPHEAPDGLWHLFAHSAWGLHHYISRDGADWKDLGLVVWNAMRPHLYAEGGVYHLCYERYRKLGMALSLVPGREWRSSIEQRTSRDLRSWSAPRTLVEPVLDWQRKPGAGSSVGNPCLVKTAAGYRLYFSASLVFIPDCGFNEPESIGLAEAERPDGPFTARREPIMRPDPADPLRNLSCGSLKAVAMEDGFIGFQNGISWDTALRRSSSAILLLKSADGVSWEYLKREPILKPSEGWMRSHVYACDAKPGPDGIWRLYFNARDGWALSEGRENIGLALGTFPL